MVAPLVLIVESNAHVQCALAQVLRSAGYQTLEATTLESARGMLEAIAPQLVVVDDGGDHQGAALIRWLRGSASAAVQALPVVGLSGSAPEGEALLGAGASRLLHKPFGPRALLAAVEAGVHPPPPPPPGAPRSPEGWFGGGRVGP